MRRTRRSVTIQDVAKAAGVSVSTVSRVLNNKDDVAVETYQKVQSMIDVLGYASSLAARGMRSRRTNVIGLIMPDVGSPYCTEVMRGINLAVAKSDYDLIIYTTGDIKKYHTADRNRQFVVLLNGSITDGVIVVTPTATSFPTDAPVVTLEPNNENPDCYGIISTNREGALAAMDYLISLGHKRIGFITGRLDLVSGCRRLDGYKKALANHGIPLDDELIQIGDFTTETALNCGRKLLALSDRPTAIFASSDMSAMGVYRAAQEAGVHIPEELSVVGFDNLPESAFLKPALTTIDQFVAKMAIIATEMVMKLVKGETLECNLQIIPTKLVIRDSCASV